MKKVGLTFGGVQKRVHVIARGVENEYYAERAREAEGIGRAACADRVFPERHKARSDRGFVDACAVLWFLDGGLWSLKGIGDAIGRSEQWCEHVKNGAKHPDAISRKPSDEIIASARKKRGLK